MAPIANTASQGISDDRARPGGLMQAWYQELAGCLPSQRGLSHRRHVRLALSANGAQAFEFRNMRLPLRQIDVSTSDDQPDWGNLRASLKRRGLSRLPLVVQLDTERVLIKHLKLPAAVNSVLDAVLRNQMRRLSPWSEDNTTFAYRTRTDPQDSDHLNVEVAIAHRPMIDELLETIQAAGIAADAIVVSDDLGDALAIPLYSTLAAAKQRSARQIKWLLGLLLASSIAISALGYIQFYKANALTVSLEQSIKDARQRLTNYRHRLDQRGAIAQERSRLLKRRGETPPAIWVLNVVTEAIPDDTWLHKLTIKDGEIILAGTSTNTAALVPLLEQTGKFNQIRFNGPTTREPNSNKESFSLSAKIVFANQRGNQQ